MALRTAGQAQSSDSDSDVDSLFDEPCTSSLPVAIRLAPPIPGLFVPPVLLSQELEDQIMEECMRLYFDGRDVNQIMLFGRTTTDLREDIDARMGKGLPSFLIQLLHQLSTMLQPWIPCDLHDHLFPSRDAPPRARQAILNLYRPGEGISPHVDLLNRFDDGIIGVSLSGSCVMSFERVAEATRDMKQCNDLEDNQKRWDLYLPERSVLVLSKDARYSWTHAIPGRTHDLVEGEDGNQEHHLIKRGTRLSITFRWLLQGADIVGGTEG
ncbi:hypothetical protein PAXRUDRAFT_831767 [Paxillus rubicundulus Ve08.2h10]|uniref:Fe2OG dioxygenase domain-containing protein n=1 Tax=Paxillus rubicundulus Ve08.2h10 TaxID=930991 RepID=A0A0D0DQW7_9AGAM|nr:hypothetical protein PAXRUDRAFT_831767 [Paxillus rubicundulus Ve08.2h10]